MSLVVDYGKVLHLSFVTVLTWWMAPPKMFCNCSVE